MVEFSPERFEEFEKIKAKYPQKEAALLPTLWMAQEDFGYLSLDVMKYVAEILEVPPSKVYGVATFYSMFKKEPTGKYLIQVCRTLSCKLRGAEEVVDFIADKLGIDVNETTSNNKFTLVEVECLGSCGTAPMMQINNDYHENLTKSKIDNILDNLD